MYRLGNLQGSAVLTKLDGNAHASDIDVDWSEP
jgi:hypothetical protein